MASVGSEQDFQNRLAAERTRVFGRPDLYALLELQPLPTVIYGSDGAEIYCNEAAQRLLTVAPGGAERVLAQDGTDLWTIVEARRDEANPFFDVRLRVRVREGQAVDSSTSIVPIRGSEGSLGGAIVFFLSLPTERLRSGSSEMPVMTADDLPAFIEGVGRVLGTDCAYVLEVDTDVRSEGRVLYSWSPDGAVLPTAPFSLRGTPSESFAGRQLLCVPDGLAEAYPEDTTLAAGGYSAYVGSALTDAHGAQIGVLAGLWREPLEDVAGMCACFTMAAPMAAHSLLDLLAGRNLRESEQRYSSVFEGSAVPIMLIEPSTTQIVDANPAACAMYGYAREDLTSMSILQIDALPPDTVQGELQRALEGSRSNFIGKHMMAGGAVRDVEVNIGPITVGGRQLLYAMINDITLRVRMEAELERSKRNLEAIVAQRTQDLLRANAELQQASTAQDMVFASLAQELRTSLQTITGFSDLLLSGRTGALDEEQRKQVEMIQGAGKTLAVFAATLAETHRADEASISSDEFDLVSLVESVVFGLAAFAEDKGLSLNIAAHDRPIHVKTDRYKLQQILLNLLSNAIRYTEKGGVTVTVAREPDVSVVTVSDTGPGLTQEEAQTVFDGPEVHDMSAGIGLPTSRRIVEALGGTIDVESTPGRGSAFTVRIPSQPRTADSSA